MKACVLRFIGFDPRFAWPSQSLHALISQVPHCHHHHLHRLDMAEPTADEILSRVTQELGPTGFACTSLTPLSGGTANFIFSGKLQKPLDDGTAEIVVKHGEGFVAQFPSLKLSTSRCVGTKIHRNFLPGESVS